MSSAEAKVKVPLNALIDDSCIVSLFPDTLGKAPKDGDHLVTAVRNGMGKVQFEFPEKMTGLLDQIEVLMQVGDQARTDIYAIGADLLSLERDQAEQERIANENDYPPHQQRSQEGLLMRLYLGYTKVIPKYVRLPLWLLLLGYILLSVFDDVLRWTTGIAIPVLN